MIKKNGSWDKNILLQHSLYRTIENFHEIEKKLFYKIYFFPRHISIWFIWRRQFEPRCRLPEWYLKSFKNIQSCGLETAGRKTSRIMEIKELIIYFFEGITPLRHWYINPNERINKYKFSLLCWLTNIALAEQYIQANVLLMYLINRILVLYVLKDFLPTMK